jgi:hypothetical protein
MVATSLLLGVDFVLETGLPQSEQKRTSAAASAVPQKEQ